MDSWPVKNFHAFYEKPNVRYHYVKNPGLLSILCQMSEVHNSETNLFKAHFSVSINI
jgi:hypothetical protein